MKGVERVERSQCFENPFLARAVSAIQLATRFKGPEDRDPLPQERNPGGVGVQLQWPCERPEDFPRDLGSAVERWMTGNGVTALLAVPEWRRPWLEQRTSHPPAEAALDRIASWVGDPDFSGGLRADPGPMAELVSCIFWMKRCLMSFQCYLAPPSAPFFFSICKHGDLHLGVYDEPWRERLLTSAQALGFREISECLNPFGLGIEGRAMKTR